jgi:hypothetical protein
LENGFKEAEMDTCMEITERENKTSSLINLSVQLVTRLERISADSYWAHQASGVRGSLLKFIERTNAIGNKKFDQAERMELESLLEHGYRLLERAARQL